MSSQPPPTTTASHAGSVIMRQLARIDRIMVPLVTGLLLVGALVILFAWSVAQQAIDQRQAGLDDRVTRFTAAVQASIEGRWGQLERWVEDNGSLVQRGASASLRQDLQTRVDTDLTGGTLAWLVVRQDGGVDALAEREVGWIARHGIADDVRAFGRSVAARGQRRVSGRLNVPGTVAIAHAVPIPAEQVGGVPLAVVTITDMRGNPLGAFLNGSDEHPDSFGRIALVDARGRVIVGTDAVASGEMIRRRIRGTEWTAEITVNDPARMLVGWAYPTIAVLLVFAAAAFVSQSIHRTRIKRSRDARTQQVQQLYELASRVLQASDVKGQVTDLARTVQSLTRASSVHVHVTTAEGTVAHVTGSPQDGAAKVRMPIVGPRSTLGELVIARPGGPLDEDETWVVQTAARLAGAGIHTLASLETERAAATELQRLDELRSNLLTTVSHELLSPLTAVKGVLGLLAMQEDLGARGQEYVEVATDRTDRLVALIRDLFDCSLLETGQLDIRPVRQRADELLESALGAQAATRPGELRLSATPNLMVTADPVRFDQLVNNLVANAFRHGAPPVEVAVRPADGGVLVVVTDEGPGIAPENRDEVFGKFWQVSSGHARMAEGAGLGLNLVRGLVELHGGRITIDSTHADGRGARFTAFLPDEVPGHGDRGGEQDASDALAAPTLGAER